MDMSNVTEDERRKIKSVLKRDEHLLRKESERIAKLRLEFQQFKRQSALRSGNQGNKVCARCHERLGVIMNRGALCPKCQHKVCSKCRQPTPLEPKSWVCVLCFKQSRLKLFSGDWFYENVQKRFQHRYLHGSDVLRSSLKKRGHQCYHRPHHIFPSVYLENVPEIVDDTNNDCDNVGVCSSEEGSTNTIPHVTNNDHDLSDRSSVISLEYEKSAFPQEDDRELLHILVSNKHSPKIINTDGRISRGAITTATDSDSTRSSDSSTTRRVRKSKSDEMRKNASLHRCQQSELNQRSNDELTPHDPPNQPHHHPRTHSRSHDTHTRMRRQDELRYEPRGKSSHDSSSHRTRTVNSPHRSQQHNNNNNNNSLGRDNNTLSPDKIPRDIRKHSPHNHRRVISPRAVFDLQQQQQQQQHESDTKESLSVRRKIRPQSNPSQISSPSTWRRSDAIIRPVVRLMELAGQHVDNDRSSDIDSVQSDTPSSHDNILINTNNNKTNDKQTVVIDEQTSTTTTGGDVDEDFDEESFEEDEGNNSAGSNFIFKRLSKQSVKKHRERLQRMIGQNSLTSLGTDSDIDTYVDQFTTENHCDKNTERPSSKQEVTEESPTKQQQQQQQQSVGELSEQEQIDLCVMCKDTDTTDKEPLVPRPAIILDLAINTEEEMLKKHTSGTGSIYSSDQGYDESQALIDRLQSDHSTAGSDITNDANLISTPNLGRHTRFDSTGHLAVSSVYGSRESLESVYSNAGEQRRGNIQISGEILMSLEYCFKTSFFKVYLKQCKDLAPVDTRRMRSDPYAKSYLLPDKTKNGKRKTKVKKNTLNPQFEETLKYCLTRGELESRTLWISIWNSDSLGHNDFLGEIRIPMETWSVEDNTLTWHPLRDRCEIPDSLIVYKGDLRIAIKYTQVEPSTETKSKKKKVVQEKGSLQVKIIEAKNLTPLDVSGTSDAFVKGYFLPEKSKGMKQKTPVIKKNCNPKWNYEFQFEGLQIEELPERCLELTVWDYDRLTQNDFLGGLRLNLGRGKSYERGVVWMDAQGEEMNIWRALIDQPNQWVEALIPLRDSMVSHFKK